MFEKYILPQGYMRGQYKVTFLARIMVASAAWSGLGVWPGDTGCLGHCNAQ